ncbi:MAG: hypothetical protein ACTSXZ_01650 [Alphaproteobacteria bacterium]
MIPNVNDDFAGARAALVDWFNGDGPGLTRPWTLVQAVSERLVAACVPLENFTAFVFTPHPDYFGVPHRWERKTGKVRSVQDPHSQIDSGDVRGSPIATVIGPAVNMAARLASICGELDEPVIVSEYFATASTAPLDPLGAHALKGVGDEEQVFRPAAITPEMAK